MSDIEKPKRPTKTKPILKFFGKCIASVFFASVVGLISFVVLIGGKDITGPSFVLHHGITGFAGIVGYTVGFQIFDGMHGLGFDLNF